MASFDFVKQKRLLEANQFKNVFDKPDKKLSTNYVLILACKNDFNHPRLGLVIGKKNVKLAVQRNRLKRQIRESFRLNQHLIANYDVVIIARRGFDRIQNDEMQKQFLKFWNNIC